MARNDQGPLAGAVAKFDWACPGRRRGRRPGRVRYDARSQPARTSALNHGLLRKPHKAPPQAQRLSIRRQNSGRNRPLPRRSRRPIENLSIYADPAYGPRAASPANASVGGERRCDLVHQRAGQSSAAKIGEAFARRRFPRLAAVELVALAPSANSETVRLLSVIRRMPG